MKNFVLVDIDHVIADAARRDHLIGGEGGWDAYHAESVNDEPCPEIIRLISALRLCEFIIVGFTARPEKWRTITMRWLVRHGAQLDRLLMRPDAAFHPAPEIKMKLVNEYFGGKAAENVAFILEDRDDVVAAFKAIGITTLQVSIGAAR